MRNIITTFQILLILSILQLTFPILNTAAEAPSDSVYMSIESEGSVVGWVSYRITDLEAGKLRYSGSGVIDQTNRFYWEMDVADDYARVYSVKSNGTFEQGDMQFQSTFEPGEAPKVEFKINDMSMPFPQEKLKADIPVVPGFLPSAFAPFSETLRDKDPETYAIESSVHNGFVLWDMKLTGRGYKDIKLRDEVIKARVFEMNMKQATLQQEQTFSLLQRPDGRFLGMESATGQALVLRGQKVAAAPTASSSKLAIPCPTGDLEAVLSMPVDFSGAGYVPIVVMIAGPRHVGLDGSCAGMPLYKSLASRLAEQGVGSLCYARRPDPESGELHFADLVTDAVSAVGVVREVPGVDPDRIGLLGHGEAAMLLGEIAMTDAQVEHPLRFLVMLSGVTTTGQVLHDQVQRPVDAPWFNSFLGYDPRVHLADVEIPILVLHGGLDKEVPSTQATDLQTFINDKGKTRIFCTVAPPLNHLLQKAVTGEIDEYATLEQRCSDAVPKRIVSFAKFCVK
jgi:hypothetical protein